jgi:hypothetical protein
MSPWRHLLSVLTATVCWGGLVPIAEAGWRTRAAELSSQAAQESERRQATREALAVVEVPDAGAPVAAVLVEDGLAVEGRPALILSQVQIDSAVEAGSLDSSQIRWLKPRASALPPNPHATTDFTAYTLQPGELKVGLLSVAVGVLPNVQVSAMPVLFYAGLPNFRAKVNAIQVGPLNVAVTGNRHWLSQETFEAAYTGVGAMASLRVVNAWSIHGGFSYAGLSAKGAPDLCSLSPLLTDAASLEGLCQEVTGLDPQPVSSAGSPFGLEGNDLYGEIMWVRAATDLRFNRRDSIILQASAVPFARLQVSDAIDVPDIAQLDEVLAFDGRVPLGTMYMASASYQMAFKNMHLRVGVGTSSLPLAWLTQTTELSMRFGGKDRWERGKQQRTWRRNRRHMDRGLDELAHAE